MRIVIIGGSHAGLAAAESLKKINPAYEVVLLERTAIMGFIPSSINFVFADFFPIDKLKLGEVTNGAAVKKLGIDVHLNTTVTAISYAAKTVHAIDNKTEEKFDFTYDRLILAMGSAKFSIIEPELSTKVTHLLTYKYPPETRAAYAQLEKCRNITIVGAGLIGLELATSLAHYPNKKITIIEQMNRPMFRYFDREITDELMQHIPETVQFLFGKTFQSVKRKDRGILITLFGGEELYTGAGVLALNPKPNVDLISDPITLSYDGTVQVNEHMQTSDPNVYAIGDLIKVPFGPGEEKAYLPLIALARKSAISAVTHIAGLNVTKPNTSQRTIGTKIFNCYLGSTGITIDEAALLRIKVKAFTKTFNRYSGITGGPDFFLKVKVIYEEKTHRLLGAQLITSLRQQLDLITVLGQAIADEKTVESLIYYEQFYAPMLSSDKNFVTELGLEALALDAQAKKGPKK